MMAGEPQPSSREGKIMRRSSLEVVAKRQRKSEPRRHREVKGVALIALGILVLTCLLTYDRSDVARETAGRAVNNLAGRGGARVAGWLFDFAGLASLFLPVALLRAGVRRFRPARQAGRDVRAAGFAMAILSACALLTLYRPRAVTAWVGEPGGAVGALVAAALTSALNRPGAFIVLVAALAIGLRLTTETSLADLARRASALVARPAAARASLVQEPARADGDDRDSGAPAIHRVPEDSSQASKKPQLELYLHRERDVWIAVFPDDALAPDGRTSIKELFGTTTVPMAFTARAKAETVLAAARKANPGYDVILRV